MTEMLCRFCGSLAIVKVRLSHGCACYPLDREQWLCTQHWYKVEPIGSCEVMEELVPGF